MPKQPLKKLSRLNGRHRKPRGTSTAREGEDAVLGVGLSRRVRAAVREEVRAQRAAGLPVTYQRGNEVVREFADGRIEVLETLPPPPAYTLPRSVASIRNGGGAARRG